MAGMIRVMLEGYLSSWKSMKHMGILTCEEKIKFDGASGSWPVFRIEMTCILIKHGLLQLMSLASIGCSGVTPPYLYFKSVWLGEVRNMAVNNLLIRWTINEGNKDVVDLWSWLKAIYESVSKLDPLRR